MPGPIAIDAHQHFWSVSRDDYGWLTPDSGALYRNYGPGDLAPLLEAAGIGATILVQAAPSIAETRYLLEIAARTPFVAGVVGWADFTAASAVTAIGALAADPLLVGLRPMVQDIEDDDWLLRRDLAPAVAAMAEHQLVLDALVLPRHLPRLAAFLDRYPDLTVVVDHGAKPFISDGILDPWRADMAAIAARPGTFCKLSGLATEAGPDWSAETLRPYVEHLLTVFGPARLLWGSDWPVLTNAGSYAQWHGVALELLEGLSDQQRAAVFGGNADAVYCARRGRRFARGGDGQ